MSSDSYLGEKLYSHIDNSSSVHDLEHVLSTIPLQLVKDFIKEYIKTLKEDECDTLASVCCPVTEILNVDIIQYILSFNISEETNSVNKLFNQLSIINQHILLNKQLDIKYKSVQATVNKHQLQYVKLKRLSFLTSQSITKTKNTMSYLVQQQRNIDQKMDKAIKASYNALKSVHISDNNNQNYDEYFAPLKAIKFIKGFNHTYLMQSCQRIHDQYDEYDEYDDVRVSGARGDLFTESKCEQLGYNGPYDDLQEVLSKYVKSGDKILLTDGVYDGFGKHNFKDMDLQLVGLGGNVILRCWKKEFFSLNGQSNIYFENIKFNGVEGAKWTESYVTVGDNSCLWFNKCSVIWEGGSFITSLNNTTFSANGLTNSALVIHSWAKNANVINSVFENCGRIDGKDAQKFGYDSCIQVEVGYECDTNAELVMLKCIGNTFTNNLGFTVSKKLIRGNYEEDLYYYGSHSEVLKAIQWFDEFDGRYCVLRDNVLKGVNGLDIEQIIDDANKLYQHVHQE